jgi:hypothetical protein
MTELELVSVAAAAGPGRRCGSCTLLFPILVDDSDLCISCDALLYPSHQLPLLNAPPLLRDVSYALEITGRTG